MQKDKTSSPNSTKPVVVGIPKRTLKFRSWDSFYKRMSYDPIISDGTDGGETASVRMNDAIDCHDGVIMQFTGLVDKNGVEIYEGDIVKSGYQADEAHAITVDDFHGFRFMIGKNQLVRGDAMDGEVIGNVFQNSELLG